jgi:hypothetical protein
LRSVEVVVPLGAFVEHGGPFFLGVTCFYVRHPWDRFTVYLTGGLGKIRGLVALLFPASILRRAEFEAL